MDTTDPDIVFDENGICNHCKLYEKNRHYLLSQKELDLEVEKIKESGKGKKYDCIIGLSGGVDSSMVAYLVVKSGLRPLAIHLDNGWDSELSVANIERIVRKLGIDFETHVINWEEFKDLQLSFLKASVANCEAPTDHAIISYLYRTAAKHDVKYIIHGGNLSSEAIMPRAWGYDAKDLRQIKGIHRKFGKVPLKTYPTLSIWRMAYYALVKKIHYFPILNYVNYDKEKSKEFLIKELGWQNYGGKHEESLYTKFFQGYILPKKFGFDKRRAHFSTLINAGQVSRDEALKQMEISPYGNNITSEREYVVKKLGITSDEFERIMDSPTKKFSDYPNDSLLIQKLVFIYVWVKKILVK